MSIILTRKEEDIFRLLLTGGLVVHNIETDKYYIDVNGQTKMKTGDKTVRSMRGKKLLVKKSAIGVLTKFELTDYAIKLQDKLLQDDND